MVIEHARQGDDPGSNPPTLTFPGPGIYGDRTGQFSYGSTSARGQA